MSPIHTFTLANQPIWLFDLNLEKAERAYRRIKLDSLLAEFFAEKIAQAIPTTTIKHAPFWQNFKQFVNIVHTTGQPAQAVFLDKNTNEITLPLAISYALPYVAVAIFCEKMGSHTIGLDMCAVADFAVMSSAEKQHFCHDYFPHLPITHDSKALARRWSAFEATLKYHRLPLEKAVQNPFFQQNLPPVSVQSDRVFLNEQAFWLSVAVA